MDDFTLVAIAGGFVLIVAAIVLFARPFRGVEHDADRSSAGSHAGGPGDGD